jgi:UDP-glucose 4-epimerase
MKIFLAGCTGFIGSCVLEKLVTQGHTIAVLLRPGSDRRPEGVRIITGDLLAPSGWAEELLEFGADTVVDLAWEGVVGATRNDPDQTLNVHATAELVKLAHRAGAKHWVGLGSQAEYGPSNRRVDEQQPTNPTTLYGVSKLAAGWIARGLSVQLGLRCAWLRLFSAYGPGDDPSWLIPSLIRELGAGRRPSLTRCEQLWDFVYVRDVAEAILAVAASPSAEGVFNLGSGQARPLLEIVTRVRDLIDPALPLGIGELPYRRDQVMHLEGNIDRLQQATGWCPRTGLDEGLKQTVAWFLPRSRRS